MQPVSDAAQQGEHWKRKYYDSLEQAERKEKQWQEVEDLLRRTISRITLAADGLDQTLDGQLRELRDAIRDRADHARLRQRIEAMSRTLVKLDDRRATRQRDRLTVAPTTALMKLLDELTLPRGTGRKVKALRRQLANDKPHEASLDAMVSAFADLIEVALNLAAPGQGVPGKTTPGGLFATLFGPRHAGRAVAEPAAAPGSGLPPDSGTGLATGRELLLHLLEGLSTFPEHANRLDFMRNRAMLAADEHELRRVAEELVDSLRGAAPGSAEVPDPANARVSVQSILIQLLQQLQFPEELDPEVDAIRRKLESSVGEQDYVDVLKDIASIVSEMRGRIQKEKQDIEKFLEQLTERLQQIDHTLQGTHTMRKESLDSSRILDAAVQDQVRGIEDSVREAADLDQLKGKVQERLERILLHMEQHTEAEEKRHRGMEREMEALNGRLKMVEIEAEGLRERIREERMQALTDPLTGIANRLAYDERVEQEFVRWKRFGTPLTLLVWDVDRFKAVNDDHGHKAGDKALQSIAKRISAQIRETDFLARYGGEEFVMVMPGADKRAAAEVAEKLRESIANAEFRYRGVKVPITLSCGVAEFQAGDHPGQVFEKADKALYRAKENGRNRVEIEA